MGCFIAMPLYCMGSDHLPPGPLECNQRGSCVKTCNVPPIETLWLCDVPSIDVVKRFCFIRLAMLQRQTFNRDSGEAVNISISPLITSDIGVADTALRRC